MAGQVQIVGISGQNGPVKEGQTVDGGDSGQHPRRLGLGDVSADVDGGGEIGRVEQVVDLAGKAALVNRLQNGKENPLSEVLDGNRFIEKGFDGTEQKNKASFEQEDKATLPNEHDREPAGAHRGRRSARSSKRGVRGAT